MGLAHAPRVLHERVAEDEENFREEMVEMFTGLHRFVSQSRISRSEVEAAKWIPSSDQSSPLASSP